MAKHLHRKLAALFAGALGLTAMTPASAADSLFTWSNLRGIKIYHVYAASDGKSYLEEITVPSSESVSRAGPPAQQYFDLKPIEVKIGRAQQGAIFEWHWAVDYRHLIIPQQGNIFFDLGDGRTLELKAGEAILAEDWTGRGHRSGCAPSKVQLTCVAIDILIDANPRAIPLRAPPTP